MELTENPIELVNDVTEDDYFRFSWYHIFHEPSQKWRAWACYAIAVSSPPYFMLSSRVSPELALLAGLGIAVIAPLFYRWEIRSQVRQQMRARPGDFGEATLRLSPEGLHETSDLGSATLHWTAFRRIVSSPDAIYMYRYVHQALIIPRRMFASSEAADAFLAAARKWHAAATQEAGRNPTRSSRTSP